MKVSIVIPIRGTVCWGPNGERLGRWGFEVLVRPMALDADGSLRALTTNEARQYLTELQGELNK